MQSIGEAPGGSCFDQKGSWRVLEGPESPDAFKIVCGACNISGDITDWLKMLSEAPRGCICDLREGSKGS